MQVPVYGHITANKRRTGGLFIIFMLLLGFIGFALGEYFGDPLAGIAIAAIIFGIMFLISYFSGAGVATALAGAKPARREQESYLYNLVEGLSIAAGLPAPKIYIIETDVPNAFAAGRKPDKAVVAVTRGLLNRLNRVELEGVIAHELAHIGNFDILLATVAVVLAGTIVYASAALRRILWMGGRPGHSNRRKEGGQGSQLIMLLLLLFTALLAPLFAQLLRFAISRQREFLADATAADLTGYPEGLASALEKITGLQVPHSPLQNEALQGLYIINPAVGARAEAGERISALFSTHPPVAQRIRRLREM